MPLEPLQTRGKRGLGKSVDYKKVNNGVVLLQHREEEDEPQRVRLMSYRTTALSKLDVDDNYMMHELESTILHIFRSMQTSDPNVNDGVNPGVVDDEFIDSIEAHQAIMIN